MRETHNGLSEEMPEGRLSMERDPREVPKNLSGERPR
jgi:hypothetical protein